jgi:2-polyprenyl-3-methyl-5-hydroxy-6-metoxy-1,4-benzoquinol methylase
MATRAYSAERMCTRAEHYYAPFLQKRWTEGVAEAKFIASQLKKFRVKGRRVLDFPCGTGRVSVPLAKLGYNVTGIDVSKYFLHLAQQNAKAHKVAGRTKFVYGKMQNAAHILEGEQKFDAVANVFTSIGYGTKADDIRFFRALHNAINPGGLFFISLLANKESRTDAPWTSFDRAGGILVMDYGRHDTKTSLSSSRWDYYRDNRTSLKLLYSQILTLRLYSQDEIKSMLKQASWEPVAVLNRNKENKLLTKEDRSFNVIARAK